MVKYYYITKCGNKFRNFNQVIEFLLLFGYTTKYLYNEFSLIFHIIILKGIKYMESQAINIASQIKSSFYSYKELEMSVRSKKEGSVRFFIRNNECQKIAYNQFTMDASTFEDVDLVEMPMEVYRRLTLLVYAAVSDLHMDLNCSYVVINWNFDIENNWQEKVFVSVDSEIHMKRM